MPTPYPLRTTPFFRDYLWGGRNLGNKLGKSIPSAGVWAESWEIVDHPEHQSRIQNGPLAGKTIADVAREQPTWLLGKQPPRSRLPLLLKYLDCQRVLSVQVHPEDSYAARMSPPDLGKTEAWYIVDAEPGAKLYAGLKSEVDEAALRTALDTGQVESCLHVIQPSAGDCVFIPAGTVHALGAGLLVAEIQQASNTTFRLFDWNRVDQDGNPRQLHIEQALEVIDFRSGPRTAQTPEPSHEAGREHLVRCDKFVLDRIQPPFAGTIAGDGQAHLLTLPQGAAILRWDFQNSSHAETLKLGQSVLLPASMPTVQIDFQSDPAVLLDMYLP